MSAAAFWPSALVARVTHVPRTYPFWFSFGFTAVKTGAADAVTQLKIEGRKELDVPRNLAFWVFGAWFLGGVQYWFYVNVLGKWFSRAATFALLPLRHKFQDTAGQRQVVGQVAVDMLLWEVGLSSSCRADGARSPSPIFRPCIKRRFTSRAATVRTF